MVSCSLKSSISILALELFKFSATAKIFSKEKINTKSYFKKAAFSFIYITSLFQCSSSKMKNFRNMFSLTDLIHACLEIHPTDSE